MKEELVFHKESDFVKLKEVSKEKSDFRKKSQAYTKNSTFEIRSWFFKKKKYWLEKEKLDFQK